jgi:hypothetical protein
MRLPLKPWLIALTIALAPVAVVAQEPAKPYEDCTREPTDGDVAAAKGAFQAGQGSFNEADYQRAITYWEDALRRDCTASALLLNLARAYELSGNKRQAVVALQTYLVREANSPQRDQIQRRIDVLNGQIAAEQPTAATAPTGTAPPPTSTGTVPPPPPPDSGGKKPILPLVVAGAGGAIAIVGGIMYLSAASEVSDFEEQCPGRVCPPGVDEEGANSARDRQQIAGGIAIAGLAIGGAGLIWYFVSEPEAEQPGTVRRLPKRRTAFAPAVAPGFAGIAVRGSF